MNAQNAQWLILVLVNIPVFLGLGRIIFSDWNSFFEALRLWTSADWWFTLQKQWQRDRWETAKLPVFVLGSVALVLRLHASAVNLGQRHRPSACQLDAVGRQAEHATGQSAVAVDVGRYPHVHPFGQLFVHHQQFVNRLSA